MSSHIFKQIENYHLMGEGHQYLPKPTLKSCMNLLK